MKYQHAEKSQPPSTITAAEPAPNSSLNFLESLFSARSALISGLIGQSGCALMFWWDLGDQFYIWFLAYALAVCLGRILQMNAFDKQNKFLASDESGPEDIKRWFAYYRVGSSASASVIGCLAAYSIYFHPASWASGISLALTMGSMVAAVGRNFGNDLNIKLIVGVSFAPIMMAFSAHALESGNWIIGLGSCLLLIPFMAAVRTMASEVKRRFGVSENTRIQNEHLQLRYLSAVTNMPNGLMTIDHDGRIEFVNSNMRRMFGLDDETVIEGVTLGRLFSYGIVSAAMTKADASVWKAGIKSLVSGQKRSVPLVFGDKVVEFTIRDEKPSRTTSVGQSAHVIVCEDVTERENSRRELESAANIDGLSQIANRPHMRRLVKKAVDALGDDGRLAICMFDVDKFKDINDTMGHAAGDAVIKYVASSMKAVRETRPDIVISRLGGDEFVIVVPDPGDEADLKRFFDDAFAKICRGYDIEGKTVEVRCSGGVICVPKKGFDLDLSMNKADFALYQVKQLKKTRRDALGVRWMAFDGALEQEWRNKQQMRVELERAIDKGQMIVYYQPMYTPDGLKIDTAEALCRWDHPELGFLPPEEFIALAESMNIIGDITRQVIRTACRDCASWDDETCVSVNLSALDLTQFEIVDIISDALVAARLAPERLQVEITETIFLKDSDKARHILHTLNHMGVKTAMDDFGTGYSNLATIHELPLNKVKIDRSFITKIAKESKALQLFEAVATLGKIMELEIVVEGVENVEQLESVKKVGVDLIQGYLFGKPMSNHDMAKALRSQALKSQALADSDTAKVIPLLGRVSG